MRKALLSLCVFLTGQMLAQSTPSLNHVVVVALENHSYNGVVGNSAMPYLNGLINQYGLAKNFYANTHGSFPDYAMLTTGELITQAGYGLPDDFPISIDNIARQLTNHGKTWRAYAEGLPSLGYTGGDAYPYVKRHNPFAYTSDVLNSSSQANNIVQFSQFANDLASSALPNFSFVIPNVEDDGEDCPSGGSSCQDSLKLSTADQWLQTNIAPLFSNPQFQNGGLLVIWWDEGDAADNANSGGKVAVVLAGPIVKAGYSSSTFYRHENLLRTLAEGLGLGFPGASIYVSSMAEFFGPNTTAGGSITGHVSDASTGAAIAGATVSFNGSASTTDSSGNYSFPNVASGTYSLTASHSGYSSQTSSVTVNGGAASTLNFQLTPASSAGPGIISGHVTNISNGNAVSGAIVSYNGASTTADSSGAYTLTNVAAGAYNVTASHSGYFKVTQSVTVSSGTTSTLNFALATGGIVAGKVTNSSGAVIAGAAVKISGGSIFTTVNTTTNSSGYYNSNWVPVGSYTVTVSASGHATQSKPVNIVSGSTATLNFIM